MIGTAGGVARGEPFLRWAGGKRWLAPYLVPLLRDRLRGTFREPFLGAGAIFVSLRPGRAALSDLNDDLICAWMGVKEQPDAILAQLRRLPVSKSAYNRIRATRPRSRLQRAVRFIYLNRTCYGGLYRTNIKGQFNVPYGGGERTASRLWSEGILSNVADVCQAGKVVFRVEDFAYALRRAKKGDVCYLDPTFSTQKRESFDRYNPSPFRWQDQARLAVAAEEAAKKGSVIAISNVDCKEIRDLYSGELIVPLSRQTGFGRANGGPRTAAEVLIILDSRKFQSSWKALSRHLGSTS